ncbi:hypothetical protein BBO99_00007543 [Phytophthora kernoviae]|uniref:DNA polymerase alpha/delta/epsilon subunit B domain-containing protein n=2 Tax=Phytophthora kernoviae TaxID=325452 RepID=A0A421GHJ0_9STRA|nr:hypothetical protein G195_010341 [Phytophthora kernoviae 00238/432]KAG2518293.1 hypothetical protein JM16_007327 [Phytophthora kernoviae]KAG2520499.1 hypothetical protein JM18_007021 [Phytophthora kernoviae]RLN14688.1 hypothetical protein BBI17_007466 [Phytophthora kernoviae]RLN76462.1 hypothetical protein BBO99_00007543 [Phytophthora kernoviae]
MQLHNKIHRLGLAVSPRNENATQDKNVIDLWKVLSSALSSATNNSQYPLLRSVVKSRTDRSRFCFVEVQGAADATIDSARKPHRLRVYFTEQTTFQWLREEIAQRCNIVPMYDTGEETEATTAQVTARHSVDYNPTYQRFVLKQKSYAQQFSHIYVSRLQQLRDIVTVQVDAKNEGHVPVLSKIIDLKADGQECVLIGTLLKILGDKPDIFKALTSESGVIPIEKVEKPLATTEDELLLEDESGRVELVGDIDVPRMVTGVVLGVRGRVPRDGAGGQFHVDEIFLPSFPPQYSLPERAESEYVALVSGLAVGQNSDAQPLRNHVLMDYLAGRLGDDKEKEFVSKIVRTVVVGNMIASTGKGDIQVPIIKRKTVEELALDAEPLKNADELVSTLAAAMCVDLMPGPFDPSNYTLPQQSFHPCLFPRSSHFKSFRCVTNPYEAQVGGVQLFGHSGQPLQSMLQCTLPKGNSLEDEDGDASMVTEQDKDEQEQERALDYLEQSLEWRHAAPTAPDLLACFPMANEDPFILENCPHVYFAGNQPRFSTRLVKGAKGQEVRLITVPSFSESSTIVLVDLKDLSCFPITIGA